MKIIFEVFRMAFRCFVAIATLYVLSTNAPDAFSDIKLFVGIISIIWILNPSFYLEYFNQFTKKEQKE